MAIVVFSNASNESHENSKTARKKIILFSTKIVHIVDCYVILYQMYVFSNYCAGASDMIG